MEGQYADRLVNRAEDSLCISGFKQEESVCGSLST